MLALHPKQTNPCEFSLLSISLIKISVFFSDSWLESRKTEIWKKFSSIPMSCTLCFCLIYLAVGRNKVLQFHFLDSSHPAAQCSCVTGKNLGFKCHFPRECFLAALSHRALFSESLIILTDWNAGLAFISGGVCLFP